MTAKTKKTPVQTSLFAEPKKRLTNGRFSTYNQAKRSKLEKENQSYRSRLMKIHAIVERWEKRPIYKVEINTIFIYSKI
jgi:hypothetical protein